MNMLSMKVSTSTYRDKSTSHSPVSPTIVHYHQKYQKEKNLQNSYREIRHHYHQKQQNRHQLYQCKENRKINKIPFRQRLSNIWEIHKSSNGRIYYYNIITDKSQWEKPTIEQLSSIRKKSIHSKQISDKKFINKSYHLKNFTQTTITSSRPYSSHNHHHHYHYKRKKYNIQRKSSFNNSEDDKINIEQVVLSTPMSPPENEKIHIDLVDPIPTPNNININNSIEFIESQGINYKISFPIQAKQSIHNQSSLCLSQSTTNAILALEHLSPILSSNTTLTFDYITKYYRADLMQHVFNCPTIQVEQETIHLLNKQIQFITSQLTSLRTDLFTIRLKFERNRFQLLKYHYNLINQENILKKLQLIDSD